MPFREFVSRLKSTRKPRRESHDENDDNDGEHVPGMSPSPQDEHTTEDSSQKPEASAPKAVRGLRKTTVSKGRPLSLGDRPRSADPEPSDYLYFGEGRSPADVSQSLQSHSRSKSANSAPGQPPTGTHTHSASTGKDSSGFINSGLSTHTAQMGYSNLTYGGSLQYDYAGTQGPGFG